MSNTKAKLLERRRFSISDTTFAEVVIWQVPSAVAGSQHLYKYRLVLIDEDVCVLRYDNEAGKGDHKHIGGDEVSYEFAGLDELLRDFEADIQRWRLSGWPQ